MLKITVFVVFSTLSLISSALDLDYPVNKQQIIVEDHFIGSDEPSVIDALWTEKHVFKVAVNGNGSSRDGYAEYVCQVLYENGYKGEGVLVRVVDYQQLLKSGDWVNLGTAHCK